MVVVVAPSSGGNVLANSSSVCQFLVTEVRRATTVLLFFTTAQKTPCTSGQIGSRVAVGVAKSESRRGPFGVGCGRAGQN